MNRKVFLILLLLFFIIAFFIDTSYYNVYGAVMLLCIAFFVVFSFVIYKEKNVDISRVYFRPIHLFVISFVIVCFQQPIDILLGYQKSYYMVGKISLMPEAVRVSLLGLISFFLGYIFDNSKTNRFCIENHHVFMSTTIFKFFTSLMIILTIIFIPKNVLLGGYHTVELAESNYNYFSSWSMMLCNAFFIQYIINNKIKKKHNDWNIFNLIKNVGWWQNINMFVYIILILSVGDRGPLLYLATAYYIVYLSVTGKCPSKKTILIGLIGGILFAAFLGYSKSFRDNNTIFERLSTTWESNPYNEQDETIFTPTYELSTSYRCLTYSIEDIQLTGNYGYGMYQLRYILSCIPFVNSIFDLSESSGNRITKLIQENITYGNGTTVIADFYLDGGLFAVIICMFLFGYSTKFFELILLSNRNITLFVYCFAFCFSMYYIYIPRSALLSNLKGSLWVAIIIFVLQKVKGKKI